MVVGAHAADTAPAAAPPDMALQAAKTEFEEGQTLYLQEKYDDAAAKFLSAYERKPFGAFLFNAAVSYEKANKLAEAIPFFEKYLQAEPDAKDAAEVRTRIEGLRALVAPPPPPPGATPPPAPGEAPPPPAPPAPKPAVLPAISTKGLVIIDSKPPGASIYLDSKKTGVFARTPWQGSLEQKPVKIIVEAKGFKPEERQISPRRDKIYEVYVALSEEHFLGWIEVVANVAGADVFIDKREIGAMGRTPYTGHVKPGKHTIWVQRPGYEVAKKEIDVSPGTATTHNLTLEHVPNGWISVVGKQSKGGRLKVDGAFACNTPCQHQVSAGKHKVAVEHDDMDTYKTEVTVERSQEALIDVRFAPKPPKGRAWTAAIFSAAFIGGGIYLGSKANQLKSDLERDAKSNTLLLDTNDSRVTRGKYMAIGADALFGLGALTAIFSGIGFLTGGTDSTADVDQRMIGFAPLVAPTGLGVAASGRF